MQLVSWELIWWFCDLAGLGGEVELARKAL